MTLMAVAALVVVLPGAAAAKKTSKKAKVVGRVYTETNDAGNNQVIIFNRYSNGTLKKVGAVSTGGKGGLQPQPGCMPTCPFLDTQGEVVLTKNGKLLFVVNAGSDSITSFKATATGLKKANVISSGGKFPNSLTIHGNLLYVLNSDSANIAGFTFSSSGSLTPITGSSQALVGGPLPGISRQIGFDNTGTSLMVTLLANMAGQPPAGGTSNTIDTFSVNSHGVAGPGTAHNSTGNFPFAFAFNKQNQSIVAQVNKLTPTPGTAQRYTAGGSPVGTGVTTVDFAPCWVVVTSGGGFAYIVNTGGGAPGGGTVAEYKISSSGALTRIANTKALVEFVKTDEALSRDDAYLYVVSPAEGGSATAPGPKSHIDIYKVASNGTLKLVGQTPSLSIPGLTGIAAY